MKEFDTPTIRFVRKIIKTGSDLLGITFDPTCLNKKKRSLDVFRLSKVTLPGSGNKPSAEGALPAIHYMTLIDDAGLAKGSAGALLASYRRWSKSPTILNAYDRRIGNWSKIVALKTFLENDVEFADDDIVVFTDASDVTCLNSPDEAVRKALAEYGCDVLFGAETRCAKACPSLRQYFDNAHPDETARYLNSGFVCGTKADVYRLYSYFYTILTKLRWVNINKSDQAVVTFGVVASAQRRDMKIAVDYKSLCVTTINSAKAVPVEITSPFVHVTSLRDPRQQQKWKAIGARSVAIESV